MDIESDLKSWKSDSYRDYLLQTTMATRLHKTCKGKILSTTLTDTANHVLRELMREGFQGAPVLGGWNNKKFISFIDMLDIVTYITGMFTSSEVSPWKDFFMERQDWRSTTVEQVIKKHVGTADIWSYRSPDVVYESMSTFHAMEILNFHNAHRIAVLNNPSEKNLVNIFTQSMVISEVRQHQHLVATLLDKNVREFTKFFKTVISIRDNDKAINGFKKMGTKKVTGLAVVNEQGFLDDSLTTTDLKGLGCDMEHMHMLFKTVKEFKAHVRTVIDSIAPKAHYDKKAAPVTPVVVSPNDKLKDVLERMDDGNLHRVFVCTADSIKNGALECTDVITQGDFIDIILKNYAFKPVNV